ncbi:DUF2993 domain-containing protein [Myxacorys almedinensis]|uniref:LmeA family phospholipid-binding protein n=1 Tax=Myxacorys almedinensis A TaxID=2690445 RepID=A0A8J7Z2N1_9CYAN|nr:DUF2993 domain-containing protein [Myxacorys almedinensis]NDJ17056.1 LmeA family phospholipid-binding protein [Myxacorys almedinensis A]
MSGKSRPEDQAVSNIIKQTILRQLDSVRQIGVATKTNLLNLFQGRSNSISVKGRGLTKEGIRIQELEITTDQIAIDPLSIFLGKIGFNEPVNSRTHLVLTEADLIQALNSKIILEKLPHLHLEVNRKLVTVELCPPFSIRLPSDNKIRFSGGAKLQESQQVRQVSFSVVIRARTETQPISLETFSCLPEQGLSLPFTIALLQRLNAIAEQPYFQLEGTILKVCSLKIKDRTVLLDIETQTQEIPFL